MCKLHLSLQPRFIARFNQLVSLTSQTWDPPKPKLDSREHEENDPVAEEQKTREMVLDEEIDEANYGNYEDTENAEESQEIECVDQEDEKPFVKFQETSENVEETPEDALTAAEEHELYEENDELYDPTLESTEAVVNDYDVVELEEIDNYH